MHSDWTKAAKKAGVKPDVIPEVLQALGMDPKHPSTVLVESFTEACRLIHDGQPIAEAAAQVIASTQQTQSKEPAMASRDNIKDLYPGLEDEQINIGLEILGIPPEKPTFPVAKLEEFKEFQAFIEAGQLDSWEDIREHWQQLQSKPQPQSAGASEAITVSQSGVVSAPTTIPEEMRDGLAAPIIETIEQDIEEVPGKMALAQQSAQSDVMDGLEGFVKTTYYQGMQERIQTPEFAERVREALRSGKSRNSSKS
ncbi:MAG: hypothetical protein AAF329_20590 [Cyanobacteria bacterium P01_A01_bin.17]